MNQFETFEDPYMKIYLDNSIIYRSQSNDGYCINNT